MQEEDTKFWTLREAQPVANLIHPFESFYYMNLKNILLICTSALSYNKILLQIIKSEINSIIVTWDASTYTSFLKIFPQDGGASLWTKFYCLSVYEVDNKAPELFCNTRKFQKKNWFCFIWHICIFWKIEE